MAALETATPAFHHSPVTARSYQLISQERSVRSGAEERCVEVDFGEWWATSATGRHGRVG